MSFTFDERRSDSPFINTIWHTRSSGEGGGTFTSVAVSHWELVLTRQHGITSVVARGPETKATAAPIPGEAEFLGFKFRLGTYLPFLPTSQRVDGAVILPSASGESFWLNGSAWPYPDFEDADVFLSRLVRRGVLARDPVVDAVLHHGPADVSTRTLQRRFLHATGLTHGAVVQIERAQRAAALLTQGHSIADTVFLAGYADQPHLTRSLRRLVGQTPAQLLRARTSG